MKTTKAAVIFVPNLDVEGVIEIAHSLPLDKARICDGWEAMDVTAWVAAPRQAQGGTQQTIMLELVTQELAHLSLGGPRR